MYESITPRPDREDHEPRTVTLPDRDDHDHDHDDHADLEPVTLPAALQDVRFAREPRETLAEAIAWARGAAYTTPTGAWRTVNVAYAVSVAPIVIGLGRAIDWAGARLSRFLLAVLVGFALAWALNHIPVTAWLVPDQADVSTWGQPPAECVVEAPIEAPGGAG